MNNSEKIKQTKTSKSKIPLYLSLFLLALAAISYFSVSSVEQFFNTAWDILTSKDEKRIATWVEGFGWLGPVMLILAMVVQMFLLVIPSVLLMAVTILAYGPLWGSVIIFIAIFVASTVGFWLGKLLGVNRVAKLLGEKTTKKVGNFLENYGFWAVFLTRLNPFLSNDAISFVAGILGMGYWRFMAATLFGIAPLTLLLALTGENVQTLESGLLWGSAVSLILFVVYVWYDKSHSD